MINDVQVAGKKGMVKAETQPSAHGIRIEPRIDEELKQKVERLRDLSTNFNISLSDLPVFIFHSLRLQRLHKRKCARLEKGIVTHGKGRMKTLTSLT